MQPEGERDDLAGTAATVPMTRAKPTMGGADGPELPLPEELTTLLPKGDFSVESFLGAGGMGAVYKGTQVRLQRDIAIKIMRRDQGRDHGFEERFRREALAMAKLNHPNIVHVIDYGEAGPDFLYIAMEFIDGADLMEVIRAGRMTQEMVLILLPQICDALQFAHDHGIVHRDIKPGNIMLTRDGRVKMADFGLAKRYDVESSFRTQTGTGMGTPDYAAPEQFDPASQVDHRADIYALGVMIYQMITGQLPRGVWKPPSQRADCAPQWDDIVSHAMQSDPEDRYQKASEIKTDVTQMVAPPCAATGLKPPMPAGEMAGNCACPSGIVDGAVVARKSKAPLVFAAITGAVVLATGALFLMNGPRVETQASSESIRAPAALPASVAMPSQPASASSPATATQDRPFINSLGMKFVPVPIIGGPTDKQRVLFSVWETRVQDYEAFVNEPRRASKNPEFEQGPTHPALQITWTTATEFCEWLTGKERTSGVLGPTDEYRLPSDHEWSCAVGIGDREDAAQRARDKIGKIKSVYYWGVTWPPPQDAGNFPGEESASPPDVKDDPSSVLAGWRDAFPHSAPVGSFRANEFGLFDMAGNAAEWALDLATGDAVSRSASFKRASQRSLLSSTRLPSNENFAYKDHGFRCVLAPVANAAKN